MSNQTDPAKVVNGNDNFRFSWLGNEQLANREDLAKHIPLADWLIKKYSTLFWKNHPSHPEYQYIQYSLCLTLEYPEHTRKWTLRFLSHDLYVDPIVLMNDPSEELKNIPTQYYPPPK